MEIKETYKYTSLKKCHLTFTRSVLLIRDGNLHFQNGTTVPVLNLKTVNFALKFQLPANNLISNGIKFFPPWNGNFFMLRDGRKIFKSIPRKDNLNTIKSIMIGLEQYR